MAKPYPILPLSVLDELSDLNGALDAYQQLMTAWIQQTMTEGAFWRSPAIRRRLPAPSAPHPGGVSEH